MSRAALKEFDLRVEEVLTRMRDLCRPSEADSPPERKLRVERCRHDDIEFARHYFPHYCTRGFSGFHHELYDLLSSDRNEAIAAPRGHAKSVSSMIDVLGDLAYGRKWFVIQVSSTRDLAEALTTFIGLELAENPRLRQDFGELLRRPWAADDFVTTAGQRVWARGYKQPIRGQRWRQHRPDSIRLDDMEDEDLVRNPTRITEMLHRIKTAIVPALSQERGGSLKWLGTLLSPRSALAQAVDPEGEYRELFGQHVYRATGVDGEPLWPEMFTAAALGKLRRQLGSLAYNQEYENRPSDETSVFRAEWIRYYDPNAVREVPMRIAAFVDPSIKEASTSAYKAIVVLGRPDTDRFRPGYYVLGAWVQQKSIGEMYDQIFRFQTEFAPDRFGFESNSYQDHLANTFMSMMIPPRPIVRVVKVNQTANKDARITAMQPDFENGLVHFIKGDPNQERLVEQLLFFPGVAKDGPDALEGAMSLLRQDANWDPRSARYRRRSRVAEGAWK